MVWDGQDRRVNGNERLAVQETLQLIMKDNINELRTVISDLAKQVTVLATTLSDRTIGIDNNYIALTDRVVVVEKAHNNLKSFVAGVAFSFGCLGGIIGAVCSLAVKLVPHG